MSTTVRSRGAGHYMEIDDVDNDVHRTWYVGTSYYGTGTFQIGRHEGTYSGNGKFAVRRDYSDFFIDTDGNVGIGRGNWAPGAKLDVDGQIRTSELEITAGSDVAEPFEVRGEGKVEHGMVVSIDPANPGQLRLSSEPYDRKVAGIISGANGLSPGLTLSQADAPLVNGSYPVALTGRVWCWADASSGSIQPGDRLTTSATPGYAMKVRDNDRASGAVIGKAMTNLDAGQGFVLVLVQPQ